MFFRFVILSVLWVTLFSSPLLPDSDIENLLAEFAAAKPGTQELLLDKIILRIIKGDSSYAKEQINRLLNITSNYNSEDRIKVRSLVLIYSAYYGAPQQKISALNKAFWSSEPYKIYQIMAMSRANLSDVYRGLARYDSAMACLWDAKLFFERAGSVEDAVSVFHRIGDYYYDANLLDKAEYIYKSILISKGAEVPWKKFRFVVITNNLGLIEMKRENFDKAEKYYKTSLEYKLTSTDGRLDRHDSTQLTHIYTQLCKIYILAKKYEDAESALAVAFALTRKLNRDDNLTRLHILTGNLLFAGSKYTLALRHLDSANTFNNVFGTPLTTLELYRSYYEIYNALGNHKNALFWGNKFWRLRDSVTNRRNAAAFLQIKLEKERALSQNEIQSLQRERYYLSGITILIFFVLIIISVFYFRLKLSGTKLISRSLELLGAENKYHHVLEKWKSGFAMPKKEAMPSVSSASAAPETGRESGNQYASIIAKLELYMIEEKPYLDAGLTLEQLSEKLNTNRSYLSNTINRVYKQNFNSFINELRIKESIRLISEDGGSVFSVEGIGKEAGFNNRISFISAFKKYTGVTPSFFIKNIRANPVEILNIPKKQK